MFDVVGFDTRDAYDAGSKLLELDGPWALKFNKDFLKKT